jgi:tetratricopeptide (TPR) repeat protein
VTRRRTSTGARARRKGRRGRAIRGRGWIVLILVLAVLAGLGLWSSRLSRPSRPAAAADARGYLAKARAAEGTQDYDTAITIYQEGLARFPRDPLLLGFYGSALKNRSFAVRSNRGRMVPVAPTSLERVHAAEQAIALFDAAERVTPRSPAPALNRGVLYAVWGLPNDALAELYRAAMLGDRSEQLEGTARAITLLQMGRPAAPDATVR